MITTRHKCICPGWILHEMETPTWLLYNKHLHSLDKHICFMCRTFRTCTGCVFIIYCIHCAENAAHSISILNMETKSTFDLSQGCLEYSSRCDLLSALIIQSFRWVWRSEPQRLIINDQNNSEVKAGQTTSKRFRPFTPQDETHLHALYGGGNIHAVDILTE